MEADIGKVIVRTLTDPRTVNAKVVIKINDTTQREIVATWEKISGKKVTQNSISAEDFIKADGGSCFTTKAVHPDTCTLILNLLAVA